MVFGPFDYRPNVNIPPDVFQSLSNRYSGALQAFQEPYEKASQRVKWQQAINQLMQDPNVSVQAKTFAPLLASNPELAAQVIPSLIRQQVRTTGAGKRMVYQTPDGTISLSPVEGATPLEVSDAQAMQYTAVPKSTQVRSKAMSERAEAWQRSIDVRQIDELARTTGITPHQRNILQQNNMRADRAIQLAQKPMTWQEFNMVLTDAAAIMQGGVPHIDQLNNAAYPTWQQEFAKWQTIATSRPTENVPLEIQKRVMSMIQGVKTVDNRYLQMNAKFQQKMLGPTIRGGLGQMAPTINSMTQQMTGGDNQPTSEDGWIYTPGPGGKANQANWKKQ